MSVAECGYQDATRDLKLDLGQALRHQIGKGALTIQVAREIYAEVFGDLAQVDL